MATKKPPLKAVPKPSEEITKPGVPAPKFSEEAKAPEPAPVAQPEKPAWLEEIKTPEGAAKVELWARSTRNKGLLKEVQLAVEEARKRW